ncbi:MAG: RNA polymerase sporulation sigma factor SigH [Armatimonadota bacterium]|nr:RNA polymerase sporulation sigma factor SigH [Armatimonadota bacterium]
MKAIDLIGSQLPEQRKTAQTRYTFMTDQEIVECAQFGEDAAAEYLLYKYRSLVRTKVRSYFLMGAEKEDLLQIGMIGLWQATIDYRADKEISFLSFARICIERHVITAIKTATRQKQTPLNTSVSLEYPSEDSESEWNLAEVLVADDTVDPEELVLRREDTRRLQEMLRRLLSDFEWSVLAGYQVGKSYREIASELRCKTKSVDNALARIKRKVSCTPYVWPGVSDNN